MSALDQGPLLEALRRSYGGSDNTAAAFWRPQYVQHNTPAKARDFGQRDNLSTVVSGVVGSEAGAATLFFKVTCAQPTDLRVLQGRVNDRTDRYISVGISDANRQPLALDERGFARRNDIHNSDADESLARQPPGVYYFTVSSSQWQSLPFAVALLVISYRELAGAAEGQGVVTGRLAMAQLRGNAGGGNGSRGALTPPGALRVLAGVAGGGGASSGGLAIPRGTATGSLLLEGRLKQTFRLQGASGGALAASGSLSVSSGGGGYGY